MGVMTWTVEHIVGSTVTTITDWQSASLRRGRSTYFSPLQTGGGVITGRNPASQPDFKLGDRIRITCASPLGGSPKYFTFYVSNYEINYGIVANQDVWTLELEDYFATRGREIRDVSWAAGTTAGDAVDLVALLNPYIIGPTTYGGETLSAQTLNDANVLSVIQTLFNTDWFYISTYSASPGFNWRDRLPSWSLQPYSPVTGYAVEFSDQQSVGSTKIVFDRLRFGSLADDYYDKVIVKPDGLAEQTAGSGERVFEINTYNQTTADAKNLADYLLAIQDVASTAPAEISAVFEAQPNATARQRLLAILQVNNQDMYTALITFRGTDYPVFIIGETWSVTPDQTRVTYNLFSADNYRFLVLDDATFGKLDSNKLGW